MDAGGFNWTLITIVGAAVLAIVIAWVALRNRRSNSASRGLRPSGSMRGLRGGRWLLRVHAQTPAADRRSATRSVRSQVKSGSVRPKCPWAAVFA